MAFQDNTKQKRKLVREHTQRAQASLRRCRPRWSHGGFAHRHTRRGSDLQFPSTGDVFCSPGHHWGLGIFTEGKTWSWVTINSQYEWSAAVLRGSIRSIFKAGCAAGPGPRGGKQGRDMAGSCRSLPVHRVRPMAVPAPRCPMTGRGRQKLRLRLRELTCADGRTANRCPLPVLLLRLRPSKTDRSLQSKTQRCWRQGYIQD